ncbi:YesL family protein [Halalkalibacter akibai]|uniref:DUF624 domain-containing protein n=1 Tax=Halalkalibacter akibai (strain ATCC 43226 / DSM 21942 / CIP 109018 / JCM 9157 / 1139) TaxID=1236973 RepID=W4QRL8_HALA3|nr:YesL family protein [Halalkalibacter akibai]GAE33949.1 hypothetical protein JCM9157_977 [Halalkalibacter akibai JCM 9157]
METKMNWTGKLLHYLEWGVRVAYLNVLWIAFTLLGLIVLGFMPATAAMFSVLRKWFRGEQDIRLFSTYWQYYKQEFLKINGIGLTLLLIGAILYVDMFFLVSFSHWVSTILLFILGVISFCYVIVLIHIFPVYVHFRLSFFHYFKYALMIGLYQPFRTFLLVIGTVLITYLLFSYPGTLLLFSGSSVSAYIMWLSLKGYDKIAHRYGKLLDNTKDE